MIKSNYLMKKYTYNNICRIFPPSDVSNDLKIVNFVLETKIPKNVYETASLYRIHVVLSGSAEIEVNGKNYSLNKNDVFVFRPSFKYAIKSSDNFSVIYVSFIGAKVSSLLDRLNVTTMNFIFQGNDSTTKIWETAILEKNENFIDISAQSVLFYTLSELSNKTDNKQNDTASDNKSFNNIKNFIDKNFDNPKMSLDFISEEFFYSKKYLSFVFKKNTNLNFTKYLNILRVQKASSLLRENKLSIKEVCEECGFCDQLYFSKVFKSLTGFSPVEFRKRF